MKSFDCKQCAVGARQSQLLTSFFKKRSRGGETRTDSATVKSRRMASARFPTADSTWDYLVTFTLSDGSDTELIVRKEQYIDLTAGTKGTLTWEGDILSSFTPD